MMAHSLYASELFWFSYKIMTQNSIVTYEQKNISPAMIPFEGKKEFLCSIPLPYASSLSKIDFLRKHFDDVLPCFYPLSIRLIGWNNQYTKRTQDTIELIIEPVRFTVDFKDEFATINTVH